MFAKDLKVGDFIRCEYDGLWVVTNNEDTLIRIFRLDPSNNRDAGLEPEAEVVNIYPGKFEMPKLFPEGQQCCLGWYYQEMIKKNDDASREVKPFNYSELDLDGGDGYSDYIDEDVDYQPYRNWDREDFKKWLKE